MEVKLTENQIKILTKITEEKIKLQNEFQSLTARESELLTMLAEASGYIITKATVIEPKEGGILVFKEREPMSVDKEVVEPKKSTKAKVKK